VNLDAKGEFKDNGSHNPLWKKKQTVIVICGQWNIFS